MSMLTAEQVREAIERHSAWIIGNNRCFHDGAYEEIADELNTTVGNGTCHIAASATDGLCSDNPRQYFKLSCGHGFTINGLDAPIVCAVCGKAVKR